MRNIGVKITTFLGGGKYQHKIWDIVITKKNRELAISDEVVEMQKKVNEKLYEQIPDGSGIITSVIEYTPPKK